MNYRDLFTSDEFQAYQREMVKSVAKIIDRMMWDAKAEQMNGALKIMERIFNLPKDLCPAEEMKQPLAKLRTECFTDLTVELVREKLTS